MKKDRLYTRVRRELTRESMDPAPDSFYEEIWRRIRNRQEQADSIRDDKKSLSPFGVVCWKSVPVFGAFLLAASLYLWYFPPESEVRISNTAESYVLDAGEIPTDDDLLYQIMFLYDEQGLEKNP